MTIGERIKSYRLQAGMTQKELATLCEMADSAIRKYESGKITPKFGTVKKIATALNISPAVILGMPISPKTEAEEFSEKEFEQNIGGNVEKQWVGQGYSAQEVADFVGWPVDRIKSLPYLHDKEFSLPDLLRFSALLGVFWADFVDDDDYATDILTYQSGQGKWFLPSEIRKMRREFYNRNKNLALYAFGQLNPAEQEALLKELQKQQAPMPAPSIKSCTDEEGQRKMQQAREAVAELHLNAPADDTDSKDSGQ